MLARRSQYHQMTLGAHVNAWDVETADRLRHWTEHFLAHGADAFTAGRQALAMLYRDTVGQAQVLAYRDIYVFLTVLFTAVIFLLPWMRRVRVEQTGPQDAPARIEGLPEAAVE
jgi:DHA2 family multidrug resistance protein